MRSHSLASLSLVCVAALLLTACATGPDYVRPVLATPAAFRQSPPAGWKQAQAGDRLPRGRWWALFGDTTLDDLA
ncbi:MAG: RND transporter, partial [Luteimonas sp.]